MPDSNIADVLQQIDKHTLACLEKGHLPNIPEIKDLSLYMAGFVARNKVIVEDLAPTLEVILPSQTAKSVQEKRAFTPLAKVTENKALADFQGFVIGIVLEPGCPERPDLHGQWMSAEDIERSCDHWSLYSQKVGIQHNEWAEQQGINHPDFVCVRNWIEYGEPIIGGYKVKPGTWLQAYQAVSERGIQMLKNYEINGLSPGGIGTVWASPKQEDDE